MFFAFLHFSFREVLRCKPQVFLSVFFLVLTFLFVGGCSKQSGSAESEDDLDFGDFVDGKYDTGYVGDQAAEIEATLTARVFVDTSYMPEEDRQRFLERVESDPRAMLASDIGQQVKYARTQLQSNEFDLNLERADPVITGTAVTENGLWVEYHVQVDSLVKFKELEEKGLTPEDLVGQSYHILLPADPKSVFEKGGVLCASSGGEPVAEETLTSWNYFYYYDPLREGCPLVEGVDIISAEFSVQSSLNAPTVYPEYDLLVEDGVITMVALFGQITHGELLNYDWGWFVYEEWTSYLKNLGFTEVMTFDNDFGKRLEAIYPGDMRIVVDTYTPAALADNRDREAVNALFKEAILTHELILYNGHSFYGSLTVLDDPTVYPEETYQIFFMDSCWSYSYYTRQVFLAKSTENDPDGTRYADLVNNTEVGWMAYEKPFLLFFKNLFEGASRVARHIQPTKYSWNNMIAFINAAAVFRARGLSANNPDETFDPEIFGVSGVRNNQYLPVTVTTEGVTVEDMEERDILDNYEPGTSSTLAIEDYGIVAAVFVSLDIEHTWNADLVVSLIHENPSDAGEREVILFNRFGDVSDSENLVFDAKEMHEFNGMNMVGSWTLTVQDVAGGGDIGALKSWSLRVVPFP